MTQGCRETSRTKNAGFSTSQIVAALELLGIGFAAHNQRELAGLRFCSLLAPESNGVYYLEGSRFAVDDIADSLVLTQVPVAGNSLCSIVVDQPQVTFYRLMGHFFSGPERPSGIHPTAVVSAHARVSPSAWIGPYCVVGNADIKAGAQLISHVVVNDDSVVGENVVIESHSTIGATGVAWTCDETTGQRVIQPQIGGVWIGRDCFIGTDVTVVRGSVNEVTRVGDGCLIAHGSKIGHGTVIGSEVHFANNVSIGGSVRISDRCFLGSACCIIPGTTIALGVIVGAGSVVIRDVELADVALCGTPAKPVPQKAKHAGVPGRLQVTGDYDI